MLCGIKTTKDRERMSDENMFKKLRAELKRQPESPTHLDPQSSFDDLVEEFRRNNFHGVNDCDANKGWSYDICQRTSDLLHYIPTLLACLDVAVDQLKDECYCTSDAGIETIVCDPCNALTKIRVLDR